MSKTGTVTSRIKRGDQVVFIAGKEFNRYDSAGKRQPYRGKVIAVDARNRKVKVEGAMMVKRHRKPVPQMNREGGIFEQEAWVSISNVALIDPETGLPTRVKYEIRDGQKVRVAKSGKVIAEIAWVKKEAKKTVDEETVAAAAAEPAKDEKPAKEEKE
ncbi:MAG: 50S ribosomal protein L24 [Chloracidobacterium sp.]|nr:50S ribosomal protein L24 [Chloracidobacterium sp.]